jgi:phosphohistidine phosphatase
MQLRNVRTIHQSGVIPYRALNGGAGYEVLLVTNTTGTRWLVPKGNIEPGMSAQQSAVREALEEGGVQGALDPVLIGTFEQRTQDVCRLIDVYPLAVRVELGQWLEMHRRQRRWVPMEEAVGAASCAGLGACIAALARRLPRERAA